jgi:transposase
MENIRRVFDGSKRKTTNGFDLHGVGINNVLVRLEVHDDNKYTRNQTRRTIVDHIDQELNNKGIWVFDRGNDDKRFFKYLRQKKNIRFIARLKDNRLVVIKETGVVMKIKDMVPGKYKIYLLDKNNRKADTKNEYVLAIKEHLKGKKPIRLISSLPYHHYSIDQLVTMYLERWGVENIFKRAKQKFELRLSNILCLKELAGLKINC